MRRCRIGAVRVKVVSPTLQHPVPFAGPGPDHHHTGVLFPGKPRTVRQPGSIAGRRAGGQAGSRPAGSHRKGAAKAQQKEEQRLNKGAAKAQATVQQRRSKWRSKDRAKARKGTAKAKQGIPVRKGKGSSDTFYCSASKLPRCHSRVPAQQCSGISLKFRPASPRFLSDRALLANS